MLELDASEARTLNYVRLLLGQDRSGPLDAATAIRASLLHTLATVAPPWRHIRHRDGNPDNVELSNLELV